MNKFEAVLLVFLLHCSTCDAQEYFSTDFELFRMIKHPFLVDEWDQWPVDAISSKNYDSLFAFDEPLRSKDFSLSAKTRFYLSNAELKHELYVSEKHIYSTKMSDCLFKQGASFFQIVFGDSVRNVWPADEFDKNVAESRHYGDVQPLRFAACDFLNMVSFDHCRGYFKFDVTSFYRPAIFERSEFRDLEITDTHFSSMAIFDRDTLAGTTTFDHVVVKADLSFERVVFGDTVSFRNVVIGDDGKISFQRVTLPNVLDLSHNGNLKGKIDLTGAIPQANQKCLLYIPGTEFSKVYLDYRNFKLLFADPLAKDSVLNNDEISSLYEGLLKSFKDKGQLESYRLLDIEYQEFKWSKRHLSFLGFLSRIWWNYGYTTELVFAWTLVLVIIFTGITFGWLRVLNEEVYKVENVSTARYLSIRSRLWYAFVYTATVFFRLTLKTDKINFAKWIGVTYIFVVYIAGVICLAYMANFVLKAG